MTVVEWIPKYLEAYKLHVIRPDSMRILELVAQKIPQEITDMRLSDVRPMHLQKFINEFAQSASKSYMDKLRVLLHGIFSAAIDNDLCSKDPTTNLRFPHIKERPREVFTLEEVCVILNFAMSYDKQRIALAIMVLLLTGIRRGELLGLKDSDIDDQVLRINRAVFRNKNKACVIEQEAKTESSLRTIPLLPELAYRLKTFPHKGEFIFGTRNGTLWNQRNFSRDYDRFFECLREAEPSVRYLSPHCCRHTFATLTRESGADRQYQNLLIPAVPLCECL